MILKGSQRSGAGQLGAHLLNMAENEHVEVHVFTVALLGPLSMTGVAGPFAVRRASRSEAGGAGFTIRGM